MKNNRSLTLLLLSLPFFAIAQNAFRDVDRLAPLLDWDSEKMQWSLKVKSPEQFNEAMTILSQYVWDIDSSGSVSQLEFKDQQTGNPLLKASYKEFSVVESAVGLLSDGRKVASAGSGGVTNVADGLAKFLVKRTKEELSLAFFSKLKNELEKNADLRLFFPETTQLLGLIDVRVYDYSTYLSNLRETFIKDYRVLPGNLAAYFGGRSQQWGDQFGPTVGALSADCFTMLQYSWDDRPLVEQVSFFGSRQSAVVRNRALLANAELRNAVAALQTVQLFNRAFQNSQLGSMAEARPDRIADLARDRSKTMLFLGLLWMDARGIEFDLGGGRTRSLREAIADISKKVNRGHAIWGELNAFLSTVKEMETSLSSAGKEVASNVDEAADQPAADRIERYFIALGRFAEFGWRLKTVLFNDMESQPTSAARSREANRLLELMRRSQEVVYDVRLKKYTAAVSDVLLLLDLVHELRTGEKEVVSSKTAALRAKIDAEVELRKAQVDSLISIGKEVAANRESLLAAARSTLENQLKKDIDRLVDERAKTDKHIALLRDDLLRYGNFLAAVAEARNSDEVARAIEAFALPVGSSRLKKHAPVSIALNAYPGLGWRGGEAAVSSIFKKDGSDFFVPASLGFNVNFGLPGRWGSLSGYFPLIDVGALFAYRFTDDKTAIKPKLEWSNLFSPGVYGVYGMGWDLPIAIGLGAQRSPSLKKVLPDGSVELDLRRRMLPNAFVAVDIPITHFYTSRAKR